MIAHAERQEGAVTKICGKRDSPHGIHKCREPRGHEGQCICGTAKNIGLEKCPAILGEEGRKARAAA